MKTIKKFWGVVFILALLSTLLIGAIPQAAADSYAFANARVTPSGTAPSTALAPAGGFSILDVAQSGTTIWAVATDNANLFYLYKSADAGATWARVTPGGAPVQASNSTLIAVAPDDPSVVVLVDTGPSLGDRVSLSTNGGATFTPLTPPVADINSVSISPLTSQGRYIAIGGHTAAVATNSGGASVLVWTIGATVTAWAAPTRWANIGTDDVEAVAYSPSFLADQALLVLTETVGDNGTIASKNGAIALHVYSYNQQDWDQNIDPSFPKYLARTTTLELAMGRAQIVLDTNLPFYLEDAAAQIGFIGASITQNVSGTLNTQVGGVFSIGSSSIVAGNATLRQILSSTAINSVAWDGTNLMAAQLGVAAPTLTVWRCNNALASAGWSFLPNSGVKTPGTGNATLVLFNGANGFAFSRGNGSMVCKTTDYGKSFNGITLAPFNAFGTIKDVWIAQDGSRMYAVTTDNVDLTVFRRDGTTWQRVFILAGATAQNWLVRVAKNAPDVVYLGRAGLTNMYKSTDAGDFIWTPRTSAQLIADFAVQDANTVYVARNGDARVIKSTSGGFTWLNTNGVTALNAGTCFSLNLIADDNLIVGGTTGGFAYSTDGATTFTYLGAVAAANAGNALTAAAGLATGDWIFVTTDAAAGAVYAWQIGTTTGGTFTAGRATAGVTGLVYSNGVLYALDNGGNFLYRFLNPTRTVAVATDALATGAAGGYLVNTMVSNLQLTVSGTTNTLWARNWVAGIMPALDTLDTLTDYLTTAADAPVPVYPINNAIIQINSISGLVNAFTFQWNAPASIAASQVSVPGLAYNYNLTIYLDAAGTVPVAGSIPPGGAALGAAANTATAAVASTYAVNNVFTAFAGSPATTYYWRVRVDAAAPAESQYSAMQTFVVQQLEAIVPIISSPANGGEVTTVNPAFSWSPIANATGYRFELATDPDFANIVYTVDPATAGASVPSITNLTRGSQYFWHVKALTPTEGEWSTTANFIVAELPPPPITTPAVTITTAPAPTIIITQTQPPATTTILPAPVVEEKVVNPSYIWAIIIVGAVLVIAVIVLIVRTRRTV